MTLVCAKQLRAATAVLAVVALLVPSAPAAVISKPTSTTNVATISSPGEEMTSPASILTSVEKSNDVNAIATQTSWSGCYDFSQQSSCIGSCTEDSLLCSDPAFPFCTTAVHQGTDTEDDEKYTTYGCVPSSKSEKLYARMTSPAAVPTDQVNQFDTTTTSSTTHVPPTTGTDGKPTPVGTAPGEADTPPATFTPDSK